ncbi:MAG: cob(I)yrinic acid a,c-diamide adenosyltransferase [Prevotella sp.]|nr:cob(I)yrinic acid a,c-diamide adenosyltransferase [Prevotella sp.]MDY4217266.1 cob(I)yrinic acid a,c-diamide adenosyltransferase [Prevotella sp.]
MSKIYTKTGDKGMTSLIGGTRVKKCDHRIEAYGTIDELNANIGAMGSYIKEESILQRIEEIQNVLFNIGCNLAMGEDFKKELAQSVVDPSLIKHLEDDIDNMQDRLPTLKAFILPSGSHSACFAHVARTVCRRAERLLIGLSESNPIDMELLAYVNRLSDYLFVLSRYLNFKESINEKTWQNPCE